VDTDSQEIRQVDFTPRHLVKLFTNHMDAWGVALIITILALIIHEFITTKTIVLLFAVAALYWLGFAHNDYHDAAYDALVEGKGQGNFFVGAPVTRSVAIIGLAAVSVFLLVAFSLFGIKGVMVLMTSLLAMWAYSGRPLRFKSRPGLDLLTHALFIESFPYLMALILIDATWTRLDYVLLSLFFVSSLASQLEQQAVDFELDSQTEPNFATMIGRKRTIISLRATTGLVILIAVVFTADGTIPSYLVPFGLITLPMLGHRYLRRIGEPIPQIIINATLATGIIYAMVILVYFLVK
jgi:4-hydroxybenzoate polyprenyltransferase